MKLTIPTTAQDPAALYAEAQREMETKLRAFSLPELNKFIEMAQELVADKREAAKQELIERIRAQAAAMGLSLDDVFGLQQPPQPLDPKPLKPAPYRPYSKGSGNGRGRLPIPNILPAHTETVIVQRLRQSEGRAYKRDLTTAALAAARSHIAPQNVATARSRINDLLDDMVRRGKLLLLTEGGKPTGGLYGLASMIEVVDREAAE